jgi:hypothetical protein
MDNEVGTTSQLELLKTEPLRLESADQVFQDHCNSMIRARTIRITLFEVVSEATATFVIGAETNRIALFWAVFGPTAISSSARATSSVTAIVRLLVFSGRQTSSSALATSFVTGASFVEGIASTGRDAMALAELVAGVVTAQASEAAVQQQSRHVRHPV